MFSRIAFARFSSASPMRGKATLESTNMVTPKASRVQNISPREGETRKLPPSSSACSACATRNAPMSPTSSTT